mmetsp:Transcript_70746/g.218796  ORF Transcript_70746/g.218796 Transcript_70746/m.218796 type:complete len:229 (+) Transcript_70746:349-1035(+)
MMLCPEASRARSVRSGVRTKKRLELRASRPASSSDAGSCTASAPSASSEDSSASARRVASHVRSCGSWSWPRTSSSGWPALMMRPSRRPLCPSAGRYCATACAPDTRDLTTAGGSEVPPAAPLTPPPTRLWYTSSPSASGKSCAPPGAAPGARTPTDHRAGPPGRSSRRTVGSIQLWYERSTRRSCCATAESCSGGSIRMGSSLKISSAADTSSRSMAAGRRRARSPA